MINSDMFGLVHTYRYRYKHSKEERALRKGVVLIELIKTSKLCVFI